MIDRILMSSSADNQQVIHGVRERLIPNFLLQALLPAILKDGASPDILVVT
jgi:hypothetical protein